MTKAADVLIVGNGSIGLSCAHALLERDPGLEVQVIGPAPRPYGASPAAGAMLTPFGEVTTDLWDNPYGRAKLDHSVRSLRAWPEWLASVNEYVPQESRAALVSGCFSVNNTMSGTMEDRNFEAMLEVLEHYDEAYERICPTDIEGFKPVDSQRPLRGAFVPGEASIDSGKLLLALQAAVEARKGGTVVDATVRRLRCEGPRIVGVELESGEILEAETVILAAGIASQWLIDGIPELSRRVPRLFVGAGTAVVLSVPGVPLCPSVLRTPNRAFACGLHQVPRGGDQIYVGATNLAAHIIPTSPEEKAHGGGDFNDSKLASVTDLHFLLDCAMDQLNQDYDFGRVVKTVSGARPLSVDSYPMIGSTSVDGLWMVAGTFRDGLTASPTIAVELAEQILSSTKTADDEVFRPERPPISHLTVEEACEQTLAHMLAAGAEHKLKLPTVGWHRSLDRMMNMQIQAIYGSMGDDYVMPPVMYTLALNHPEYMVEYYARTKAVWS